MPKYRSKKKKNLHQKYFIPSSGKPPSLDFEKIKIRLKKKEKEAVMKFGRNQKKALAWFGKSNIELEKIRETSQKALTAGLVAGSLLLSSGSLGKDHPLLEAGNPYHLLASKDILKNIKRTISNGLKEFMPKVFRPLNKEEEAQVEGAINEILGINAKFEFDGNRLNTNYGLIGGEQHLKRYPGDHLGLHDEFLGSGMAPNLGAFGYFANSPSEFGKKEAEMEKYYVVTQTFLIPDWQRKWIVLKDWLKFRKVLVINPNSGQAVVAVIGDSGPATWTGKQFGGSPEVMNHLGYGGGSHKGEVIFMFVDDPEDKIPLGPVQQFESAQFGV